MVITPAKRPYTPAVPEPILGEGPIQGTAIVVIHPGSLNLRIGRASDTFPITIPHVIARQNATTDVKFYEDLILPGVLQIDSHLSLHQQGVDTAEDMMWTCKSTTGCQWRQTLPEQTIAFNLRAQKRVLEEPSGVSWTNTSVNRPSFLVGDEALLVKPNSGYNIHWPMRRGQLNLHGSVGGSLTAVLNDLESIWSAAISDYLNIPIKDLKHYRAVLIIPDSYNKWHVRELTNLLLTRLGFAACFVQQESVCSVFGAGVSTCCVVDVGDQKTSVCCIEDGLILPNSRLHFNYGGSDVSLAFYQLLKNIKFPYKECNPQRRTDALFLQTVKEHFCHMDLANCRLQTQTIHVKQPGQKIWEYSVSIGDECMMAPLALFVPELFGMSGTEHVLKRKRNYTDPEDIFDGDYLNQIKRRVKDPTADSGKQETEQQADDVQIAQSQLDDEIARDDEASNLGKETNEEQATENDRIAEEAVQVLPVDQAIFRSIERCDPDIEVKRKMVNTILVVGGGMMFTGSEFWMRHRVSITAPSHLKSEPVEVITEPRKADPRTTAWKGASVMSLLDTAQELWIRQREWKTFGYRLLRERAPFTWE